MSCAKESSHANPPDFTTLLDRQRLAAEKPAFTEGRAIVALHFSVNPNLLREVGFKLTSPDPSAEAVPYPHFSSP